MWNCRGAGSSRFFRHLKFLLHVNKPSVLILVETKIPSLKIHSMFCKTLFDSFATSEARGFAGGIWVLWNAGEFDIELIGTDDQIPNLVV